MKIALVGPGIMPIPPSGWGAVEILIWDYALTLREKGHEVDIVNELRSSSSEQSFSHTPYCQRLIAKLNDGDYDFVHIHYDCLFHITEFLTCPLIGITSHYPYIDQLDKHVGDGYAEIFMFMLHQTRCVNFVLSEKDKKVLLNSGANPNHIRLLKNGVKSNGFLFSPMSVYEETIYLGKITPRKNQAKYQCLEKLIFVGNCEDSQFKTTNTTQYLGNWTRSEVYSNLTKYTNLLLISQGEADPLVVKEALIAGLGVVINKTSSTCLNTIENEEIPEFITIVDEDRLDDMNYLQTKLEENKNICRKEGMRKMIREFGIRHFDINVIIEQYIHILQELS